MRIVSVPDPASRSVHFRSLGPCPFSLQLLSLSAHAVTLINACCCSYFDFGKLISCRKKGFWNRFYCMFMSWGDAWCNGRHVCFPCLPPMLERGFESRLRLKFSGFSMWHFLTPVVRGFLRVLRFPPHLHRLMVSANKIMLK